VVDVVVGGGATEVVGVVGVGSEVVVGDVVGVGERGGSPGPAVFVLWVDAAVPVGVELLLGRTNGIPSRIKIKRERQRSI
jgi:hypothetical protein